MIQKLLAATLGGVFCLLHAGGQEKMLTPSASCSQVSYIDQPITALPRDLQRDIRDALRPAINSIIHDPGMGMDDVEWRDAKLYTIQVRGDTEGDGLYVVSWEHPQFKANAAIWIVEIRNKGRRTSGSPAGRILGSTGGWGVNAFPGSNDLYPELMFAGKGFREGGGAEGLPGCFS
jgi:hypothetical protein